MVYKICFYFCAFFSIINLVIKMNILKIENLKVRVDDRIILDGFNLEIKSGEIHVIMGPNGVRKSTLSKVIMGNPDYEILDGSIYYNEQCLNRLSTDERARLGIFLGMQLPPEIEGVTNADMLRTALHAKRGNDFKLFEFIKDIDENVKKLNMNPDMIHRGVNQGFSGGERKKNEILQMNILKPTMVLLDEIDSGLDVDSLKIVGQEVYNYFKKESPGMLLVTHYERLLDYIKPEFVHIMVQGKIVKTGGFELVKEIEKEGYNKYLNKKNDSIGTCVVKEMINNE